TTYTVDPAAAAGCAGAVCKTISDANAAVADGDTVSIKAGTFSEPPIVVTRRNVTFTAVQPGTVVVSTSSASAGAATLTLGDGTGAGSGAVLRGLAVGVPVTGGPAVRVRATGTVVEASNLARVGAAADLPTYDVDDAGAGITGGTNTIRGSFVVQLAAPAEAGTAPAVQGGGETTLVVEDSNVVAGVKSGPGVRFDANDRETAGTMAAIPNRIVRGSVIAANPASSAVEVLSAADSAVPKATLLDSVALLPGSAGTGVRAASANAPLTGSSAGKVTVTARHVTIAGGARPFALDAAAVSAPFLPAPLGTPAAPVGEVVVDVGRSIAHGSGASAVTASAGSPTTTGSTARLTLTDSDTTDTAGGTATAGTTLAGTTTRTADAELFRDLAGRDVHLKATAPVIDRAGAQLPGASEKDFEGQARMNGAATDLGADEWVNTPPTTVLKASRSVVAQGEAVTFDATGSADTDGPIAKYGFDFGDGSPQQESAGPSVGHAFARPGTYRVQAAAVDGSGAFSLAAVTVTVTDDTAPVVAITTPKPKARIRLFDIKVVRKALAPVAGRERTRTTTTTTLRKVVLSGTAADEAGIRTVELSLRRVKVTKDRRRVGKLTRTVTAKAAQAAKCTFLDPRLKRFVVGSCGKPVLFAVPVKGGRWSFRLKAPVAYRLGSYELTARATDGNGVVSKPVSVPFTLR
ncbi:MAG: hypothetical protein JWO90_2275, partial [Solirubrobacterales bacterium]|nr:hypothetical protein [Solirubrobacterales bacterium]